MTIIRTASVSIRMCACYLDKSIKVFKEHKVDSDLICISENFDTTIKKT